MYNIRKKIERCPTKTKTATATKILLYHMVNILRINGVISLIFCNHPFLIFICHLRILTGKKHPKIQLQLLRKIQILTFWSLVHQINSFQEVLKLGQIFQKNQVVPGKTLLFMIGPFCSRHSVCLDSGF